MPVAGLLKLAIPLGTALAAWMTWRHRGSDEGKPNSWRDDSLDEWRRQRDEERQRERERRREQESMEK